MSKQLVTWTEHKQFYLIKIWIKNVILKNLHSWLLWVTSQPHTLFQVMEDCFALFASTKTVYFGAGFNLSLIHILKLKNYKNSLQSTKDFNKFKVKKKIICSKNFFIIFCFSIFSIIRLYHLYLSYGSSGFFGSWK